MNSKKSSSGIDVKVNGFFWLLYVIKTACPEENKKLFSLVVFI
ncbi:MAG: hypothetical protein PHT94_04220 [Candidatus Nanoarchaeia archaeon]|nr:hypothetical protein [Candidatus Nanoarchaeia archaeon]